MAILKKRTSSKQIPQAKALTRAPLNSVINGTSNGPGVGGGSSNSITSVGGSKPILTMNTGTSSTPSITNNSSTGTKPSLTTNVTGAPRQTLTSAKRPSSSTTGKVVNALTGAAIGAGTKMLIDKFTSKPNVSKTPTQVADEIKAINTSASKDKTNAANAIKPKAPPTSVVKPPAVKPLEVIPPVTTPDLNEEVVGGSEYYQDEDGNIYMMNSDGGYDLYRAAEVDEDFYPEEPVQEEQYYDDGSGNIYTIGDDGGYKLYRAAEGDEDFVEEDYNLFNPDHNDYYDYDVNDQHSPFEDDGDEYFDYRRGGLITMMKQGGVAKFEDGGYVDNGDGTYTIGSFTYDMETDKYLYSIDPDSGNISNVSPDAIYSTDEEEPYYDTDSLGNIFKNGELYRAAEVDDDITSAGGGSRIPFLGSYLDKGFDAFKGIAGSGYDAITSALGTPAGAAGAGALIASLLGNDFSGGTGRQNQGVDMSKVGVINPRTTDFGIGPTNFVGYEDYGTSGGSYTPNEELLRNLNAPGFNPVREGDYGYEEAEAPKMASGGLSSMATPVASYYTFGQPADILANLGMRAQPPMNPPEMMSQIGQQQSPQQMQQQGLPQQQPPQMGQQMPQGMPQQGMMPQQQGLPPPMRKGGLSHASNVPMVEGRMDFRKGAAVHGEGDGQSDDIPAMLADGEYVIDSETVAQIGNGSTKAGAQALDKFRESIRAHKRSAPLNKIPPKTKVLTSYLKGAK